MAWMPIETAPKDGTVVLLWHRNWTGPESGCFYGVQGWGIQGGIYLLQPTHWQPLTSPPGTPTTDPTTCFHARTTCGECGWVFTKGKEQAR